MEDGGRRAAWTVRSAPPIKFKSSTQTAEKYLLSWRLPTLAPGLLASLVLLVTIADAGNPCRAEVTLPVSTPPQLERDSCLVVGGVVGSRGSRFCPSYRLLAVGWMVVPPAVSRWEWRSSNRLMATARRSCTHPGYRRGHWRHDQRCPDRILRRNCQGLVMWRDRFASLATRWHPPGRHGPPPQHRGGASTRQTTPLARSAMLCQQRRGNCRAANRQRRAMMRRSNLLRTRRAS